MEVTDRAERRPGGGGDDLERYVDARTRKQALAMAWRLADFDVRWLEEPRDLRRPRGAAAAA